MAYAVRQLGSLQRAVGESKKELVRIIAEREAVEASIKPLREQASRAQADKVEFEKQIASLQKDILKAQEEKRGFQDQIASMTKTIGDLKAELGRTTDLSRFKRDVDWVDVKFVASESEAQADVLQRILFLRRDHIAWKVGGKTPAEGFDSPSFATFILSEMRLLPDGKNETGDLIATSRRLPSILRSVPEPQVGDVVFYPAGYAMFYFIDQRKLPFVIGMTPDGIVALDPGFAPRTSVARPSYRR